MFELLWPLLQVVSVSVFLISSSKTGAHKPPAIFFRPALVQLFTIATTTNAGNGDKLRRFIRPLGATIVALGLLLLFIGEVKI